MFNRTLRISSGKISLLFCFLLFNIAIILNSCNNNNPDILYEFDPRAIAEREFTLSQIADDIGYIPLDNVFPTGRISKVVFTEDAIYTNPRDNGILKYDRKGKLIAKIGSIGRGPGEYLGYMTYCVDEESGTVYVGDLRNDIKAYSKNGQFNRSIIIKENANTVSLDFINSRLFIKCAIEFENSDFEWIACDSTGQVIKKQPRHLPKFTTNYGNTVEYPYIFKNSLHYYYTWLDTVFSVLPDLSERPAFTFASGDFRWPRSILTTDQIMQNRSSYFSPGKIFESNKFIILRYSFNNYFLAFIDKDNNDTYLIKYDYDGTGGTVLKGIPNDLDGGNSFLPELYYTEGNREYLIGWQYPYQLKAHLLSDEFKKSNPEDIQKKMRFENLVSNMAETDNQVLVVVRLKK